MDSGDKVQYIRTWWSKDLARYLDIGESTLRKWCLELEKAGYTFLRDEHNRRTYIERDALALRQMQQLLTDGHSYDSASSTVANQYLRVDSLSQVTGSANPKVTVNDALEERYLAIPNEIDELRAGMVELTDLSRQQVDMINKLVEMNQALFQRLDEQQQYIEQSLNVRDERLTEALREMREERLQLAAAAEEHRKKPVWKRLLGK